MSPEAAEPDFLAARRLGLAPAARPVRASDMPREDGQGDLQALAADLDDDGLAAAVSSSSVSAGAAAKGVIVVDELGLDPAGVDRERVGVVKAGSVTTARWKGMAVAMPSTWNSASARAARWRACSRVAPVTISLASSESQAGPMTLPDSTPASRRTPGPVGGAKVVTVPGAGRKPRPGSSPLMRNSKEWPRSCGVVVAELLAVGDAEHLADQVDAGDLFGDRVLDLEAGVDLQEGDRAVGADEELDGAGADVAGLLQDRLGRARTARRSAPRSGTARGPPRPASGGGAAASSHGWRRRPRCRGCRPGTGSPRAGACRGSARRSTRRGRRRRRPRGRPSRTARGPPRGCGRPSGRGRRRRRRP